MKNETHKIRRISALLMSVAMALSLFPWALAAESGNTLSGAEDDSVKILYTNDIHTYIDNVRENDDGETVSALRYSTVAGYREAVNADFLVDAGDHIQGTSYGTYDKGHTIINLMNAAGYTAATLGNHEFDYDMSGTLDVISWADFDYVSCNIINTDGEQLLPSYQVYEAANGKKVAFLGITTPESITKSTPAYFMNENGEIVWSFSEGDEGARLYKTVQSAIDAAAKEADYVIGVGHMGVDSGSAPYTSEDVIRNTSGFTAFIDGHSHTKMEMQKVTDNAGNEIVLTQTKCYLEYVGEMTIDADGNVTAELHDAADLADVTPDPEVKAIEDEIISVIAKEQSRIIAHTDVRLDTHNGDERLVRKQETAIGNFCADATYYYFDSRGYDIDAAFMNGGGIRAPLDGDITAKNLLDIYPWGNVLCLVDMTGQQILDGLEFGAKNVNWAGTGESGGFLHVSGLIYEIDARIPDTTQSDENGIWTGGPTGEYRVSNVQVWDREAGRYEPLDLEKHYAVGGINYTLRNMGDGFGMFTGENIVDGVAVDYMALEEYAQSFPVDNDTGLPTLKENMGYDGPEGRIVITGQAQEDYTGKTVILHSNDVHGEIMGYSYIAALRDELQKRDADVILADAGDFSQGDPTVSLSKGADAITMMNAAGYDIVTLGNHEFDFGYEQLMSNLEKAEFPVICADVYKGDETILDPTWTYTGESGLTIGFFGMETPETQTKVNPGLIQGIQFVSNIGDNENALYECAQEQINTLRNDGADLVIALAHLGVDAESAPDGHRSIDLYHNTTGIDIILDGHSHTVMTEGENGEPIQSTGTKFAYIGVVVIDNESKAIEDHYLISTDRLEQDKTVSAQAQEIIDRVEKEYGTVFAKSEVLLNGERAPGNRTEETNLGDLITDAIVWKVLKEDGALTVDDDHVVGITNGGGIRASIEPGDVTRKDLNTVLPFGNTVAVVYVTGAELLEALEASTYATPDALGGYPQTFGIEFTLNTTIPYDQGAAYPESTYYAPATIQRVEITAINGEAFDPDATYAVVTNNFCAAGGDTYYVFKNASAQFDTGIVMDEAVMEYVDEALNGVISEETYAEPRGDQTIILPEYVALTDETVIIQKYVWGEDENGEFGFRYIPIGDEAPQVSNQLRAMISPEDAEPVTYQWYRVDETGNKTAVDSYDEYFPELYYVSWNDLGSRFYVEVTQEAGANGSTANPSAAVTAVSGITKAVEFLPAPDIQIQKRPTDAEQADGVLGKPEDDAFLIAVMVYLAPGAENWDIVSTDNGGFTLENLKAGEYQFKLTGLPSEGEDLSGVETVTVQAPNENGTVETIELPVISETAVILLEPEETPTSTPTSAPTPVPTNTPTSVPTSAPSEPRQGGCYVATAVYGSYDCPEVWTLRRFRDEALAETWYGRLFIRAYYAVSPTAVRLFGDSEWFRNFFRSRLDQLVNSLQSDGFASTPYQDMDW